jgi:hypothetical protein
LDASVLSLNFSGVNFLSARKVWTKVPASSLMRGKYVNHVFVNSGAIYNRELVVLTEEPGERRGISPGLPLSAKHLIGQKSTIVINAPFEIATAKCPNAATTQARAFAPFNANGISLGSNSASGAPLF